MRVFRRKRDRQAELVRLFVALDAAAAARRPAPKPRTRFSLSPTR
jgi:hypothetical protein